MYTGMAVRTALAMGINREPGPDTKKDPAQLRAESRTWWYVCPAPFISDEMSD